jgi:hypothetical protein
LVRRSRARSKSPSSLDQSSLLEGSREVKQTYDEFKIHYRELLDLVAGILNGLRGKTPSGDAPEESEYYGFAQKMFVHLVSILRLADPWSSVPYQFVDFWSGMTLSSTIVNSRRNDSPECMRQIA